VREESLLVLRFPAGEILRFAQNDNRWNFSATCIVLGFAGRIPFVSDKHSTVLTFQQVREQCEQGGAEAWRAFANLYGPLLAHLVSMYSPSGAEESSSIVKKMLAALTENDFALFRATARQSEREFLIDIRALLLDVALTSAGDAAPADSVETKPSAEFSLEQLGKLVEGLPLTHQEMVFFRLCGYTDISVENMLRVAPRVAEAAFARLESDYAAAAHLEKDRCLWPASWLEVLHQARAAKKDNCPDLHQFLRIQDGQVSWYDKEPTEKHVAGCIYCLERWTALRELGYWRRKAKPLPAAEMEGMFGALPVAAPAKKSLLRRVFGS
jgi:hypothetical protein